MSVKKYFGLTAAGIASLVATSAMAGGPDVAPAPDYSGIYLDVDAGWGRSDWSHFAGGVINPFSPANGAVTGHSTGGFAWGGDIGYQFNQYFSFEGGAYDLADVNGLNGMLSTASYPGTGSVGPVEISSFLAYVAGKLSVPFFLLDNLDIFGKFGFAWRFLDYSGGGVNGSQAVAAGTNAAVNDVHYGTVILGAGFQYWFTPEWSINVQYLHVPGYSRSGQVPFAVTGPGTTAGTSVSYQAPNVDLFLAGIGYKFNI